MKLFDDFETRSDAAPPQRRSEFEYLNQTGIPNAAPIRALFEEAFANFTGNRTDIRNKFRSKDNATHVAAAFELVLHEIMVRQGLKPSSPELPNGGTPDFRIAPPNGCTVVIEARMLQPKENVHYRMALDAIASVERPHVEWYVWIDDDPQDQISTTALVAQLKAFVDANPRDSLPTTFSSTGPHLLFEQGETRLRIYGLNKAEQPKGAMSWNEPDGELASTDDIRRAIKRKKGRYDLTEPYVLALCSAKGYASERHFREALFRESRGTGPEDLRGYWAKGEGSRVSGVLACYNFKPASIHAARMQLFLNSNTVHPLRANPFGCALAASKCSTSGAESTPLDELLGLPPGWPGD